MTAITDQATYRQQRKITPQQLSDFYADLRAQSPDAEEVYLAQDNWPVRFLTTPDFLDTIATDRVNRIRLYTNSWGALDERQSVTSAVVDLRC